MSAAAAVSFASSARRVVVVVGQRESGKSTLIAGLLGDKASLRPEFGDGPRAVTRASKRYVTPDGQFELFDTVGTDKKGAETVLGKEVAGQQVHFVVLLRDLRWEDEYDGIMENLKWANPTANVSRWAAYNMPPSKAARPPSVDGLDAAKLSQLQFVQYSAPVYPSASARPHVPRPAVTPRPVALAIKKVKPAPPTPADLWFGKPQRELNGQQQVLHDEWKECGLSVPKQEKLTSSLWKALKTREDIVRFRQKGEKLLEFHLEVLDKIHAGDLASNANFKRLVESVAGLKEHIEGLFNHASQAAGPDAQRLSDEKYADYVEAFFYALFVGCEGLGKGKKSRKYMLSALHHCAPDMHLTA